MTTPVKFEASAKAAMLKLDTSVKIAALRIVRRLANWPEFSGAKPLSGNRAGQYRVRVMRDWRLIFTAGPEGVLIIEIGHRSTIYDE